MSDDLETTTSDSEFDLAKRVQITNEIPPSSLYAIAPTGLHNDFWKYFLGSSKVAYDVPVDGTGDTIFDRVMKVVNGVEANDYGPSSGTFHSISIDGAIEPELDFFLHELYRYLGHLYPDHPDYEHLLTPTELNDAFYAAAAIIGYVPDYKFLEAWVSSATGTPNTREALKWKIRDLRGVAYKRKFAGAYAGYKTLFSSMHRHGSVYPTAMYLPKQGTGALDTSKSTLFRLFRLMDYLGAEDTLYRPATHTITYGLVDPSDLYHIYEATPQAVTNDTSTAPTVPLRAFVQDQAKILIPGAQSNTLIQNRRTVPAGYNSNYIVYELATSARIPPSARVYTLTHAISGESAPTPLVPRPFGIESDDTINTQGRFSVLIETAQYMYPTDIAPGTAVSAIPFGGAAVLVDDTITDNYIKNSVSYKDIAKISVITPGTVKLSFDASTAPIISDIPSQTTLNCGLNIHIPHAYLLPTDLQGNTEIFIEGTIEYTLNSDNILTFAAFKILAIPQVNPITGNTNNIGSIMTKDKLSSIEVGHKVDIYLYDSAWEALEGGSGWIKKIDWGYLDTEELSRDGIIFPSSISQPWTLSSFTAWKNRAAAVFLTEVPIKSRTEVTGAISSTNPSQIDVVGGTEMASRAAKLATGDIIYGPGLPEGTLVLNSTSSVINLTQQSTRFGSFTYTIITYEPSEKMEDVLPFDFKTEMFTKYPSLSTSVFEALWPSPRWPNTSLGFFEGVRDTSLYNYPVELPPGILIPSNIFYTRNLFLDLSLHKILHHPNSLGLDSTGTPTSGLNTSLCDVPWLDYILISANKVKRATEQIYVGAQLNLSTDSSGYSSHDPEVEYTDPNIQANFAVIADTYATNPIPAYLQLGTGGVGKSELFVIEDLGNGGALPPTEDAVFNQLEKPLFEVPIGEYENLLGPATPIPGDPDNAVEYKKGLADPRDPTNTYHTIQTSVYAQKYTDITTPLREGNYLILTSPALISLKRLPSDDYRYQADWNPATTAAGEPDWPTSITTPFVAGDYFVVTQTTTIISVVDSEVDPVEAIEYNFNRGDWIIWNGSTWDIKSWVLQGIWSSTDAPTVSDFIVPSTFTVEGTIAALVPNVIEFTGGAVSPAIGDSITGTNIPSGTKIIGVQYVSGGASAVLISNDATSFGATITYTVIPYGSTLEEISNSQFPYFVASADLTITGIGAVQKGDWIILESVALPSTLNWHVADGHSYDTMYSDISSLDISEVDYEAIKNERIASINSSVYLYALAHRFLTPGSCTFKIKIDPRYTAIDTEGKMYALTKKPILYDAAVNMFYVDGTTIDSMYVENVKPFNVVTDLSPYTTETFEVRSAATAARHYVKFREPSYYKNLGLIIGQVDAISPTTVSEVPGFDFPIENLSLTDSIISDLNIQIRNNYTSELENKFFNHYVAFRAMYDNPTVRTTLVPLAGAGVSEDASYLAEFTAAISHLNATDKSWLFQPALLRLYNSAYENKYYKNLLAIAGVVTEADRSTLKPIGDTSDDIRAFSDAIKLLSAGDTSKGIYTLGGTTYTAEAAALPFSIDAGLCALTVECNQSTPLLWMAGGVNGQLAYSDNGTDWTLITSPTLPAAWGTADINKIKFIVSEDGIGQWRMVGENGKCAYSLDNGASWTMDSLTGLGWGSANIYDLDYAPGTPGTWMIAGDNGQAAYLLAEYATVTDVWVMSALPGNDGYTVPLPPSPPAPAGIPLGTSGVAAGWGTDPVRTVSYGNGVWLVGGGANNPGTNVSSLLARSTDLSPDSGSAWTFSFIGESWNDFYITSARYGDGVWVVGGLSGKLAYSLDDAASWTSIEMPDDWSAADVTDIQYEYGVWTVAGTAGRLITSSDGQVWAMGDIPTSLGTTNLRATAHGNSTALGMEHIVVGDTTSIAYSTSTSQTSGMLVVTSASSTNLTIEFDSDIATWDAGEVADKTVLITILTKRSSVECELVGIPTARIPSFSIDDQLVLSTTTAVTTPLQANRVYYPHTNPAFDLVPHIDGLTDEQIRERAGYPLYGENPAAYIIDSAGNPVIYTNTNSDTLYLCDINGYYISAAYDRIPVSSFVNYETVEITRFNDSRQPSYTPRYSTYQEWISGEGALLLGEEVNIASSDISVSSKTANPSITFSNALPELTADYNAIVISVMPSVVTGTVPILSTPEFTSPTILNNDTTGLCFIDGGYGTWTDFDSAEDTRLPWEADPTAFISPLEPLYNKNGTPVYLCKPDGTFRLSLGNPVQTMAPKYTTLQELVVTDGRVIQQRGCKGIWWPAEDELHNPLFPEGNFVAGDYYMIGATLAIGLATYTQGDKLVYNVSLDTWEDVEYTPLTITAIDTSVRKFVLSEAALTFAEGETTKYVQLHARTLASFDISTSNINDSKLLYPLPHTLITKYTPDRVYYDASAYPSYGKNPSMYQGDIFLNKNAANIYYCDAHGNYVDSTKTITNSYTSRTQPRMPVYLLCQDWFKAEGYLEGQETNPYWQYIVIKESLNPQSKLWEQQAELTYLKKSERGSQFLYQPVTDGSAYLEVSPGLTYVEDAAAFKVLPANYIDYLQGKLRVVLLGKKEYDPTWRKAQVPPLPPINEAFEQYGIAFTSDYAFANVSSETEITHSRILGDLITNYYINTTQNFADPTDKTRSLVGITEMGVFNTDNKMIAYATFPPIIYDSSRHHLSLNLFIKQGEFTAI